jgi:hypothetical protein
VRASAGVRRQRGLAVRRARGGPKAPVVRGTAGDAAQEFRYKQEGVLRPPGPCDVHHFKEVLAAASWPRSTRY